MTSTTSLDSYCELDAQIKVCVVHGGTFACATCANGRVGKPCCSCQGGHTNSETTTTSTLSTLTTAGPPGTTTSITMTTGTTPECKAWCANHTNDWQRKCRWNACS